MKTEGQVLPEIIAYLGKVWKIFQKHTGLVRIILFQSF